MCVYAVMRDAFERCECVRARVCTRVYVRVCTSMSHASVYVLSMFDLLVLLSTVCDGGGNACWRRQRPLGRSRWAEPDGYGRGGEARLLVCKRQAVI